MKKKVIILIAIGLIVIGSVIALLIHNKGGKREKSLLVVASNYSFKIGATYGGTAIFDDGTIYTWYYSSTKSEYNGYVGNYSINTKDGFTKFVMDKATKSEKNVSKGDLKQINKYIKNISEKDVNCDIDYNKYSSITIYKNNEVIKLDMSDACDVNANIKELSSLINKYKK